MVLPLEQERKPSAFFWKKESLAKKTNRDVAIYQCSYTMRPNLLALKNNDIKKQ